MRCPRDTVISVQWAQYGRLATSNNDYLCSAVTWKPLSERRAAAAAIYLQRPSPRTDWLSSSVATTTVPMTTFAINSSLRRAAERVTCLASKSLEVSSVDVACFALLIQSFVIKRHTVKSYMISDKVSKYIKY